MGWVPNLVDGFPNAWPHTLDEVAQISFDHLLGGHGALESGRSVMRNLGNYIEELTGRVKRAKEAGLSVAEMQKQIPDRSNGGRVGAFWSAGSFAGLGELEYQGYR